MAKITDAQISEMVKAVGFDTPIGAKGFALTLKAYGRENTLRVYRKNLQELAEMLNDHMASGRMITRGFTLDSLMQAVDTYGRIVTVLS